MNILKELSTYLNLDRQTKLHTYLDERATQDIPSLMSTEELIDITTIDGSEYLILEETIPNRLIRKTVGEKIIAVGKHAWELGFQVVIHELYRDFEKQTMYFNRIQGEILAKEPDLSPEELWEKTTQFIADPALTPPHCTGGAVDLTLRDKHTLELLDMGTPMNTVDQQSYLMAESLSPAQKSNRALLLSLMLGEGMAPLATEWWHYSYGEKYWAAFYNQAYAIYDVISPEKV